MSPARNSRFRRSGTIIAAVSRPDADSGDSRVAKKKEVGMTFPSRNRLAFVLSLSGLVALPVRAQEFRAKLQGAVMDTTQAAVVGATVTLSNVKTGVQTVRATNEAGRYRFDFVDPGSYTIKVEAPGFS